MLTRLRKPMSAEYLIDVYRRSIRVLCIASSLVVFCLGYFCEFAMGFYRYTAVVSREKDSVLVWRCHLFIAFRVVGASDIVHDLMAHVRQAAIFRDLFVRVDETSVHPAVAHVGELYSEIVVNDDVEMFLWVEGCDVHRVSFYRWQP